MKRIHTAGISFILCIAVCSCAEESDEIQPIDSAELTVSDETDNSVEVITTQSLSGETVSSDVTITTDREVYDNDCESVLLTIANNSDEMIEYGETWSLDKRLNGEWGVAGRRNRGFLHDWIRSARRRNHRMQLCIEYISVRTERRRVPDSKGNRRQGLRRRIQNRGLKCESVPRHHRGQMATYTTRRCAQ